MSAFTASQWAAAGEYALRQAFAGSGLAPTDAQIAEARATAVVIALGDPDTPQPDPLP